MDYFSNKGMYTEKTNLIDISLFQSGYKKQTRQPAIEQAEQKAEVSTSESSEKSVKQEKSIIGKASIEQAEQKAEVSTSESSEKSVKQEKSIIGKASIEQAEQKAEVSTSESSEKSVKQEKSIISKASTEQAEQKAKVSTSESSEKSVKQEKSIIGKASTEQAEEEIIPFTQNSSVASTKLSCELETIQNDFLPIIPIVMYLKEKCLKNPTFATLVCKEEKTLSKCLQYTQQKVCKALKNKNGWLEDKQVYHYAETYYMTPNAILDWNGTSAVTEKSTKNTENKAKKTNVAQNKEPKVQKKPKKSEQQQLSF